jgi:hypothetical protein
MIHAPENSGQSLASSNPSAFLPEKSFKAYVFFLGIGKEVK